VQFLLFFLLLSPIKEKDLKPIELSPGVRDLMGQKRWREAGEKLKVKGRERQLLKGWLLERGGENRAALKILRGLAEHLPLVADFIKLTQARAALGLELYAEALEFVEGERGWPVLRIRARAFRELGSLKEARKIYKRLLKSQRKDDPPFALLGLARLETERTQPRQALLHLLHLDQEFPSHPRAGKGRKLAKQLIAGRPKLAKLWRQRSAERWISRAEILSRKHWSRSIISSLSPLNKRKLSSALKCRQRYTLGRALRKRREWKRARPLLKEAVKACAKAKHKLEPKARYLASRAAERLGFEEESSAYDRQQIKKHPGHYLTDDAGYFELRHLIEDKEDLRAAERWLKRLLKGSTEGDMLPEAIFFLVQNLILAKRYKAASRVLAWDEPLPARDFEHHHGGRSLYWRARLDQLRGRKKRAIEGYRSVISSYPMSWYALMAYSRLKPLGSKSAEAWFKRSLKARSKMGPHLPSGAGKAWRFEHQGADLKRALLFARLGMSEPALSELRSSDPWLRAWILDRAGAYPLSHNILRRKLLEFRALPPAGYSKKYWRLAYPTPFKSLAKRYEGISSLDRYFIWAVMREESGFHNSAESSANAMGLMQLILTTAKQMATPADGRINRSRLSIPELNIRLGARCLAYARGRTQANPALLPAAYNAGPGALRRWMREREHLDLDLFVETIPYEEARGYTKRVISSWATYRLLYGDGKLPYLNQKVRQPWKPKKKKKQVRRKKKKQSKTKKRRSKTKKKRGKTRKKRGKTKKKRGKTRKRRSKTPKKRGKIPKKRGKTNKKRGKTKKG